MPSNHRQPALVVRPAALNRDDDALDFRKLLPAWIISGVIHIVLLSLFLLVYVGSGSGSESFMENTVIETKVDEHADVRDANLENDDIGDDPDHPTNYNVNRIEDLSVPGPVNPNESIGMRDAPEGPAMTLPPPPGYGGGLGGGLDDPNRNGLGGLGGIPGGLGGQYLPGGFAGRSGATREKMLVQNGGNSRSEAAVAGGLKWLARHQALDGHWSLHEFNVHGKCNCANVGGQYDVAATGIALLCYLGAGETHKGTGKNHIYSKNVERGLKWLIARQGENGGLAGNGYEHSIATIAMAEGYGVTGDPWLKGPAQRATNRCITWQRATGGWRYLHPPSNDEDVSVTGWFIQAVKSSRLAGLSVPNSTMAGINQYLDTVSTMDGSLYGYQNNAANQLTPTRTAIGLLGRMYMGWGPRHPGILKGVEHLEKVPPVTLRNIYCYYYATQAVYFAGGEPWERWNPKMREWLITTQDQGLDAERKDQKGSWSPAGDAWGSQMGRVFYTALCILTLEVYYRHLPLYRREGEAIKDEAVRNAL